VAGKAGIVVNVGPHAPGMPGTFVNLGGGYRRTVEMFTAATAALQARGQARPAAAGQPAGDVTVWTFEYQDFPAKGPGPGPGRRSRLRARRPHPGRRAVGSGL